MDIYEVKDATVLLTSADFGDASALLDGTAPEAVAGRLLRRMAEAAMARSDAPYLRDDEAVSQRWVSTLISAVMHWMFTFSPGSSICAD